MVQYSKYSSAYYRTPDLVNKDYWKLDNTENNDQTQLLQRLQARGIACTPTSNQHGDRDRLAHLYSRAQRGLPFYDDMSYHELHRFCQSRRIKLPLDDERHDRNRLQSILEQADEDATFDRFLDLPPELRVRIYEMHKASLDFGDFSVAPPITSVSKLVRVEALSVFFHERLFLIHGVSRGRLGLQLVTDLFFGSAPMAILGAVRKLHILSPIGPAGTTGYAEFRVDLTARRVEESAVFEGMGTFQRDGLPGPSGKDVLVAEKIRKALQVLAEDVSSRTPVAFTRSDASAILHIFDWTR